MIEGHVSGSSGGFVFIQPLWCDSKKLQLAVILWIIVAVNELLALEKKDIF
jgi:hypothetical protein